MPRRKCVFNKKLEATFPFLETTKSNSDLHCLQCDGRFSISSGGKYDILTHLRAKKHIKASGQQLMKTFTREELDNIPVAPIAEKPACSNIEMCRLCKKYANALNAKNLFHKDQEVLLAKITELTSSTLRNEVDLPSYICQSCEEKLQTAYRFRMLCLESFAYFESMEYKDWLQDKSNRNVENVDEVDDVKPQPQQLEVVMVDIKEEVNSSDTNEDDALAVGNESDSNNINDFSCLEVELNETTDLGKETTTNPLESNKPTEKRARRRSKKDFKEKVDFICEHCGNHFTFRQHFVTHLRRHTNNKPFKCEICPKQCYTSSELKHHMRRHTGERPFACRFCDRRFTDYSTRVRHERVHTNERPYKCSQCGKAFTRSNLLQKHLLVHTGERAFKCVECDKAFQTRTSLNVHCRSILHKQMLKKHEIDKQLKLAGNLVVLKIQP